MKRPIRIHPAFGLMGFLGILGIFYGPFLYVLFGCFGFFWWGLLGKEKADERLDENIKKAVSIAGKLALILCALFLFALNENISSENILLWGSIGYAVITTIAPTIAYIIDKRG